MNTNPEHARNLASAAVAMAAHRASRAAPLHCGSMWVNPHPSPVRPRRSP
jgi:hypothetical protein